MASRARAQKSADAMVAFVDESFPRISRDHNRLANLMNAEIDKQQSNVLIKIPITGDGTAAAEDENNEPVAQKRKRKQSVANPKPAKSSKRVITPEASKMVDEELEVDEESSLLNLSPTIENTEFVGPAVHQKSATLSASPTNPNTDQPEVYENGSDLSVEFVDAPEPWDDSMWPHGPWIDGLEVIDALPWSRAKST